VSIPNEQLDVTYSMLKIKIASIRATKNTQQKISIDPLAILNRKA